MVVSLLQAACRGGLRLELGAMLPVNLLVTFLVLAFGVVALVSGVRRKYPPALRLPRPYAVSELFHDRDVSNPGPRAGMDVGTLDGHHPVRRSRVAPLHYGLMPLGNRT